MLRFFSKIRYQLAADNKVYKYMRYAIGEIVLVVIGILIALQINNWNEARKLDIAEQGYLKRIVIDLISDSQYFDDRIMNSQLIVDNHSKFVQRMYEEQNSEEDIFKLMKLLNFNSEQLTIQNSTYLELTNGGKLEIFSNEIIKESIINYYREIERISAHMAEYNESTNVQFARIREVSPAIIKYLSQSFRRPHMYDDKEWAFFNDPSSYQFQTWDNTITFYYLKHRTFRNYFESQKRLCIKLIADISSEIDN